MKKITCFFILLFYSLSCREAYNVPSPSPPTGYLVVEGFINNGTEPTTIRLSRTAKLYDSAEVIYEYNAQVSIEGENNESYPLYESINGTYLSSELHLNSNEKYRLHILTTDGKEYLSDFEPVKTTPPIDSISWVRENGVQLYINTHDPQNNTKYYQWKYEETWEFHSAFANSLVYIFDTATSKNIGVDYKYPSAATDTTILKCWKTQSSTTISLGSTEKLVQDIIFLPLNFIEPASVKISVRYSINVKQYALSQDAYLFLQKIKKNTEQLGSVFDPQPSELQGNIHCITNPAEVVVGFVEVTQEQQQRIYITNEQVPDWGYNQGCPTIIVDNNEDSILKYASGLMPAFPNQVARDFIVSFYAAEPRCIDCTLRGTNVKPDYWP